jgi:hypothetical protein
LRCEETITTCRRVYELMSLVNGKISFVTKTEQNSKMAQIVQRVGWVYLQVGRPYQTIFETFLLSPNIFELTLSAV